MVQGKWMDKIVRKELGAKELTLQPGSCRFVDVEAKRPSHEGKLKRHAALSHSGAGEKARQLPQIIFFLLKNRDIDEKPKDSHPSTLPYMNARYQQLVSDFLASQHIAVAGYSSSGKQPANGIYERLKKQGYEVHAVNPKSTAVKDVPCYPDLSSIPAKVEAVMICTPPAATRAVLEECVKLGISRVWIHRSIDQGSYSPEAEAYAQAQGLPIISYGCPMMFVKPDVFHRCFKWVLNWKGRLKAAEASAPSAV